jgi:hypothetical protein
MYCMYKKVASRLYLFRQLKRAQLPAKDLFLFNITCIRPIVEYACQVFHTGLPQYLYDDLETLQKRPLCVIPYILICYITKLVMP